MTFRIPAEVYDAVYTSGMLGKDYDAEAAHLIELIEARRPGARTLLDVCCGTGLHLERVREHYAVEGLDTNPEFLRLAAERNPGVPFHEGDLMDFDLGRTFDVVTCLFASITYARTLERLELAVKVLARHVAPGGLLVLEPLLEPDDFEDGREHTAVVETPGFLVTRTNLSRRRGEREGSFHMRYAVVTPNGAEEASEEHRFGLFTGEEVRGAIEGAGLAAAREPEAVGFHKPLWLGLEAGS